MPREVHPVGPAFNEDRELRERFQDSPPVLRLREGAKLPETLGQQPDELRLGGI